MPHLTISLMRSVILTAPSRVVTTPIETLFVLIHLPVHIKGSAYSIYFPDSRTPHPGPEACETTAPANVISISYSHTETNLPPFYAARQCAGYAKLGLMGITILYSSSDNGVVGNYGYCLTPGG